MYKAYGGNAMSNIIVRWFDYQTSLTKCQTIKQVWLSESHRQTCEAYGDMSNIMVRWFEYQTSLTEKWKAQA